jgi:phenylalanyl-tRNA synthetase beta chain
MRVPISWLREYVDFDDTPQGLADRLTFSGTEVEGIEVVGSTYEGVVVGEVLAVEKHPNADRLTLCRVNTGAGEVTVVCGAPNVKAGLKAPFAPVGVTLPNGLALKPAKIRGVESQGMLCAEDELGLSADHSGLLVLEERWAPGTPLREVLGGPEAVLVVEITPNRPDCLSMIGLAREVAALYGTSVRWPDVSLVESDPPVGQCTSVEVRDPEGCPRYTARILTGVKIGPSPGWMKKRLDLAGVRAINNVVDITNYVMLECGQPLHAFDHERLEERRIVVRRFAPGEKLATLDGMDRPMDSSMLVIADGRRPVAVAGVMGGAGSEIHDRTSTVLLESAYFKPQDNRATSKKLKLSTESSYRFERGVDIGTVEWASRRAAALMTAHAEARAARGVVDAYPAPRGAREIVCRYARIGGLLGVEAAPDRVKQVFGSLGLEVIRSDAAGCAVRVPTWRVDLAREVDLIEEFARIHGLDKVPAPLPRAQLAPGADDEPTRAAAACRARLCGLGLREIMNYSFVSGPLLDRFDPSAAPQRVALPNPVNLEQGILRPSLAPQMVETLGRNHARQTAEARFFEMGRVFFMKDGRPAEEDRLAVGLMGPAGRGGPDRFKPVSHEEMFLWTKGVWENLAEAMRFEGWTIRHAGAPGFEDGFSAAVVSGGEEIGVVGLVSGRIAGEWRITGPVGVFEVRVAPLLARAFAGRTFRPVGAYPAVSRDVAMIVDNRVKHEDVVCAIRKAAPKELERIELFDIFTSAEIGAGRKSLAYSLRYRSLDRTLTDEEANRFHDRVKAALRGELSAEIRES